MEQSGVELDARGNVKAPLTNYQTSKTKIFSCGDMRRGQSLVVWAIREGRQCARGVDEFLMGSFELPQLSGSRARPAATAASLSG